MVDGNATANIRIPDQASGITSIQQQQQGQQHEKQQFNAKIVNERASIRWIVTNTGLNRFGNNACEI